jgi:hypothetical protein
MRNGLVLALPTLLAVAACGSSSSNGPSDGSTHAEGSVPVDGHGNGGQSGMGAAGSDAAGDQRDDGVGGNTHAQAQADCGAIELFPPIVEVIDAVTGAPICDPAFTVDWPDGGPSGPKDGAPFACGQSRDDNCPGPPDGGGTAPCTFALAIFNAMNVNVEVSKPDYATTIVQVSGGVGGCVPYVPASHVRVELHPVPDASADGG